MNTVGIIGLTALAAGWVPQTFQTIKEKECKINTHFLILSFVGSVSLMLYAVFLHDVIFSVLNFMTAVGALINFYYRFKTTRVEL
jgi:MtN3 and saliva related transmembrane protein